MGNKSGKGHAVLHVLRILGMLLVIAACLLGCLSFALGLSEHQKIQKAAAQYAAAEVRVTETRFSDQSENLLVVVLEPNEEIDLSDAPHRPRRLGKTVATTGNRSLAVGDVLTMYYDPENTDTRIVDFQTAAPMMRFGALLGGGMLCILLVLLCAHFIRKRRHKQPAAKVKL